MINIVWPTARPNEFRAMYSKWLVNADEPWNIKTYVAVDNCEHQSSLVDYSLVPADQIMVIESYRPGVVYPAYQITKDILLNDKDIVILASDDILAPQHWDDWINDQFNRFSGCLVVNDGFQTGQMATLPIVGRDCFEELNKAIYHPSYYHLFSDQELFHNASELKLLKDARNESPIFEHFHYGNNKRDKDSVDIRAKRTYFEDKKNFENRMKLPLAERLRVSVEIM